MARLRTWEAFEARGLWPGERKLVDACKAGEECFLGDGTRPEGPSEARNIRADLLRYFILGGCEGCRTDELGVQLIGAYITGELDLSFAKARGQTDLRYCQFKSEIEAVQSRFEAVFLNGSAFPALNLGGAKVIGHVFLRDAEASGEVSFSASRVGGQLDCSHGKFRNASGIALNAQGLEVADSVFFRGSVSDGEVSIAGAKIGGQLSCNGATFQNTKATAFNAERVRVELGLYWTEVKIYSGFVSFISVSVGDLVDDLKSWPEGARVILDGFTYDRISGVFLDAPRRLEWLRRGTRLGPFFFPQPYTQLAKVLREMGHDRTARAVLIERSKQIRKQVRADARIEPNGEWGVAIRSVWADLVNAGRWGWGCVLYGLTGYGYAPWRSVWGLVVLLGVAWVLAWGAWQDGSFAPNDGAVLVSEAWQEFADDPGNPAAAWSAEGAPGMDWDSFNAFGYAADLVVPILDLGQTEAWAPSKDRGSWGWGLWWGRWVLSALGWVVTALGAAAITGITQPRRE